MASIQTPLPTLPEVQTRSQRIVLQVEDNPANASLVSELIARRSDLKLLTATDGQQGIEMACTFKPDLILMDMVMPSMDGLTAIAILRGHLTTSHIPVIALSSNAFSSEIKKCLEAGAFRYLTKPYKIESLMTVIDEALKFAADNRPAADCGTLTTEATRSRDRPGTMGCQPKRPQAGS